MKLSAKKWFRVFVDALPSDCGVQLMDKLDVEQGSDLDTQWTHVMSVFLMRLAWGFGYFQKCNQGRKRIDFVWYEGDSGNKSILIEHENRYKGAIKSELPKLLKYKPDKEPDKAILRVLITYTWTTDKSSSSDKIEQKRNEILGMVRDKIKNWDRPWKGEFLLIIGDSSLGEANTPWDKYWHGYIFDKSGRYENLK